MSSSGAVRRRCSRPCRSGVGYRAILSRHHGGSARDDGTGWPAPRPAV